MEKIIWNDRVKNEEVLQRVKEERDIQHKIKERKTIWIDHILLRNCLLKLNIEGQIEGTQERRTRLKQLLGEILGTRRYWKLREEALNRILWRTRFRRLYGSDVRQAT
jgi:hypothetical protein